MTRPRRAYLNQVEEVLKKAQLHQSSTLPNLSQLSLHHSTLDPHSSTKDAKNNFEYRCETKVENPSPTPTNNVNIDTNPVAFIKVEEDDHFDNEEAVFGEQGMDNGQEMDFERDVEGFFVDENIGSGDVEDKDLKAVLNSDQFNYEAKKAKRKLRKTKRKTKVEFDDSDDEPLKKKTDDQDRLEVVKPSGRRKKKEEIDTSKEKKRVRREKPAGVVTSSRVSRSLQQLNVDPAHLDMVLLSWQQVEEERQKALRSDSFTRHDYRCYDCAIGFNHRAKLDNHMRKHDQSKKTLEGHLRSHTGERPYRCALCPSTFGYHAALYNHTRLVHLKGKKSAAAAEWSLAPPALQAQDMA